MIERVAFVAAIVLPLWNIPLIVRIVRRKSSDDISLLWAFGVWFCMLLMAPSGFTSDDRVWRAFNISSLVLFSGVVITVMIYHKKRT